MLGPYKHVSFDLDGTLVHTTSAYRYSVVPKVVDGLGGVWTEGAIDEFWFQANRDETIKNRFRLEPEAFWNLFKTEDDRDIRMRHTHAYPECASGIKLIKALGKTVSILTGAPRWLAELEVGLLEDVTIDHLCPIRDSGFGSKPCPDSMRHALETLGHAPGETLYIGNGAEDALFADASGCDFVLIDRGEHRFPGQEQHRTIRSLEELIA